MTLSDYDRRKFELAEVLRGLGLLRGRPDKGRDDLLQDLFAKLAEDRFNLVVVGRFSRGKSTLMNAIIGLDRLPTGIAPLTSVITAVSYGSEEGVEISFEGRLLCTRIPLAQLADYVTQEGNPGNVRGVRLAEVQLPAEILRRGFYFIDTPGLGSAIAENTETTAAFLPAADAFLLVTSYESPLSAEEFEIVRRTARTGRRLFVVVNKQDMVADEDQSRALAFVRDQLARLYETDPPKIFSTSALQGLHAKQAKDDAALEASGVGALEEELVRFLINEKSQAFLLSLCDRIGELTGGLAPSAEREALWARLREIRQHIDHAAPDLDRSGAAAALPQPEGAGVCEICRAVDQACIGFVSHYQYDLATRPAEQDVLVEHGGLCRLHSWWYANITSPHGVAVALPPLLEHWSEHLNRLSEAHDLAPEDAAHAVEQALASVQTCRICQACAEAERAATATLAGQLDVNPARLEGLSAICLVHLPALLRAVQGEEVRRELLRREAGVAQRIAEDMRRYALKFDGLRRTLLSEAEDRSPTRALRLAAGVRNLSFAKRID